MVSRKNRQLSPVGGALDAAFSRLGLSGRLAQQRAVVIWPDVVGPQVAAATRALGVREGILFVAAKSSTWAQELILRKMPILRALEKELGQGVIADIRFLGKGFQDLPVEEKAAKASVPDASDWQRVALTQEDREEVDRVLGPVADPDLRLRLERVLTDSLRVKRWKEEHGWARCKKCGLPHDEPSDLCGMCRFRRTA